MLQWKKYRDPCSWLLSCENSWFVSKSNRNKLDEFEVIKSPASPGDATAYDTQLHLSPLMWKTGARLALPLTLILSIRV